MDSRKLNVLHHRRHKGVGAVADGIRLAFQGMVQKPIDQNGPIRRHSHGSAHIFYHTLIIIDHFHASAPQHIGGANHHRISDLLGNGKGLLYRGCHS